MNKFLPWIFALGLSTALAQIVEVDIKPDDLLAGSADETLQQLGARAVAEEMTVTITAPSYWSEMIEEQVRAGAGEAPLEISHRETFIESVIVRLYDRSAPPKPAVAAAKPAAQAQTAAPPPPESPDTREARAALREQSREPVRPAPAEPMAAEVPRIAPEIRRVNPAEVMGTPEAEPDEPVTVQTTTPLERDRIHEGEDAIVAELPGTSDADPIAGLDSLDEVVEEPRQQLAAAATDLEEVEPASVDQGMMSLADAQASLEERLNQGRPIGKRLSLAQLRRGDQVFTTGPAAAVVRSSRVGRNVYWLDGELNPEDEDVRPVRAGKYEITGRVDVPEPEAAAAEPAAEPAEPAMAQVEDEARADERSEMEARYNEGRPIESTLSPSALMTNDILYVGDELIVVVRRDKVSLRRYWLVGDIDLSSDALEQRGNRKYRVRRRL